MNYLQLILNRLRAQLCEPVGKLRAVDVLADDGTDSEVFDLHTQCAYVLPLIEHGGESDVLGIVRQPVRSRYGVLHVVENVRGERGGEALIELVPLRNTLMQALLGWEPEGSTAPFTFVGGQLKRIKDGVVCWMDQFEFEYEINKEI